jgi:uncharacterized heparinase superfamily protein
MAESWTARRLRWGNRLAARLSRRAPPARGFRSTPEPRTIGLFARGRQLAAGNFVLAGHLVESRDPFGVEAPSPAWEAGLHGFGWLDHLAACGERAAREAAQGWVEDWITRFGDGTGPGWTPDLTGRRVTRWISNALFLTSGRDNSDFFESLGRQTDFLARRWHAAEPGLPRFEALTGLAQASLALSGMGRHLPRARQALAQACAQDIDGDGGLSSRNPEELLEVFTLLGWAQLALSEAREEVPGELRAALARIAPTLRTLRHADGGLARFHGGGRGIEGRLEHALAVSGLERMPVKPVAMGFARLDGGRTSVIVDASAPPRGAAAHVAHASTLAFELTSNRRPVIVNCGSGLAFGPDWQRGGRATLSHSTLSIDGFSSSRFGRSPRADDGRAPLLSGPGAVTLHRSDQRHASALLMSHDGYVETHGLTHIRNLDLSVDGRALLGEDTLAALDPAHRKRFSAVLDAQKLQGVAYALRFHLHPDADPSLDMNGAAVSVALPSGEIWVFRFDGPGRLTLEPSVYLEPGRLAPRPCQQIVLRAVILDLTSQINWTLAKAQDTPLAIRDTVRGAGTETPLDLFAND